jgi:hypothetical protein
LRHRCCGGSVAVAGSGAGRSATPRRAATNEVNVSTRISALGGGGGAPAAAPVARGDGERHHATGSWCVRRGGRDVR